uniref:Chromosome 4 open reading frame 19 n=1 Tax=Apteryx owenii TaxID=8824 RepID=A0A8B9PZN8_APTOW
MGCRCCKMIKSYIFDPEEAQSPGYTHEVNSYKQNEQDSNKFKFKQNSEIQEHKNELQKDELKRTENKNQVNSTKETLWNHRGNAFQEDSLGKCVAKLDVAVNGGNSCAGAHPSLNPNISPMKEASKQGTFSLSAESSSVSTKDFYTKPNESGQKFDLEAGSHSKSACKEPNSIQDGNSHLAGENTSLIGSAILETQNNAIQLPNVDYPQNGSQTRNYIEKDSFSINYAHSDQNTRPSAKQDQDLYLTPPLHTKESSTEPFKTYSVNLSEDIPDGITAKTLTKAAQAPTHPDHRDINGEIEEEDTEVAAALAALEAATAGEDLEDDNEVFVEAD